MSCGIKIKSIKKIKTKPIPVFDISVEKNHNFILKDGCVVHNCKPYQYLKSTIYEERMEMYENVLLTEELIGLERNNNSGKIDHTPSGINSKDQADALCGAVWSASKHAEEFAFDYGETLETIATVSTSTNYNSDRKQLSVDFEQELNKMFDPIQQTVKNDIEKQETKFLDFGMGKATSNFNAQYITQGIILF